jgi:uncharacterized protein
VGRPTGYASLPLHGGKAPAWLFGRMVRLSREIIVYLASEYDTREVLRRLADPFWFQAFGCVLGFDWHSSGVTTTVCGAVKEGLKDVDRELGFFAAGGKGRTSRKTPGEIDQWCDRLGRDAQPLVYASRTAAKVDSAAVQDGYQLYHHVFFFTGSGDWCVVQQGMSDETRMARRYHWLSEHVASFVDEPHEAVCCDARTETLNLVAHENEAVRRASAELASQPPSVTMEALRKVSLPKARLKPDTTYEGDRDSARNSGYARTLFDEPAEERGTPRVLTMPRRHELVAELDVASPYLQKILEKTYERAPKDFEALLGLPGVGPKTLRALALASELVHGTAATLRDPARFAFAHGGKDGTPFPVDRITYDQTIEILNKAINRSTIDRSEKVKAFKRLAHFASPST